MLTLDQLKAAARNNSIDTVIVAFTDMQGRLVGKRVHGSYFVEHDVATHGIEGCAYLLTLDMEMDPVPGYAFANWDSGYGDLRARPDVATLRRLPWLDGTALVLCDLEHHDGTPAAPSPRQVLKRQVERARELGFEPMFGSELEFYVFRESYEDAYAKQYRLLTPSAPYILDYHVLAATYDEPLIRQIRNGMQGAGIAVESSKGRGLAGAARDQLRLHGRAHHGRQPRRLQERGQGDRAPERALDHLHGEARRDVDR